MKLCNRCNLVKPLKLFSRRKVTADGHDYTCKSCISVYRRGVPSGLLQTRRRYEKRHRLAKYGLTPESFAALWDYQHGRCAVCTRRLALGTGGHSIDHDHETGATRGILCVPCNLIEGLIRKTEGDPKEFVGRLQTYLATPPWQDVSVFA